VHSGRETINFRQETAAFFYNIHTFEERRFPWNTELQSVLFGGGWGGKICPVVVCNI